MYTDLRFLAAAAGPFLSVVLPAPSNHADAAHRFDVEWRNARKQLRGWNDSELDSVEEQVVGVHHGEGEALVVVRAAGGPSLLEVLDERVHRAAVHQGRLPRLAIVIEARQRAIPHVVVETDRTGAAVTGFDGGRVLDVATVDGETLHIHRGHPGGWSQRRFQQRAENTWEHNAADVADAVASMAADIDACLVAIAGDVRAKALVAEALPAALADRVVIIDAGSPDGIADDVVRLLSDLSARRITALADRLRTAMAAGAASIDTVETLTALAAGRVDTLLVHDDGGDGPTISENDGIAGEARVVDIAIAHALRSDATIVVVPNLAVLGGPVAALLRW